MENFISKLKSISLAYAIKFNTKEKRFKRFLDLSCLLANFRFYLRKLPIENPDLVDLIDQIINFINKIILELEEKKHIARSRLTAKSMGSSIFLQNVVRVLESYEGQDVRLLELEIFYV